MLTNDEFTLSKIFSNQMGIECFLFERFDRIEKPHLWLKLCRNKQISCVTCAPETKAFIFGKLYKALSHTDPCFVSDVDVDTTYRAFDWCTLRGERIGTLLCTHSFLQDESRCLEGENSHIRYEVELRCTLIERHVFALHGSEMFQVVLEGIYGEEICMDADKYVMSIHLGNIEVTLEEMGQIRKGKKIYLSSEISHEVTIKIGSLSVAKGRTHGIQEIEILDLEPSFIKQLS